MYRTAKSILSVVTVGLMTLGLLTGSAAAAPIIQLDDSNSHAEFDLDDPNSHHEEFPAGTSAGLYQWKVDQVNRMFQEWFWFRVGNTAAERPVADLSRTFTRWSDVSEYAGNDVLSLKYAEVDPGTPESFMIEVIFTLMGGPTGSGQSDMAETIKITNTGTTPLDMHFFEYTNFDISASDTITFPNANTVVQSGAGGMVAETVVTPSPSHRQAGLASAILGSLTDATATTLTDNAGAGPGDLAWVYEWERTIPAGDSLIISKDKNIVPEPATMVLMAGGLMMSLVLRRKR